MASKKPPKAAPKTAVKTAALAAPRRAPAAKKSRPTQRAAAVKAPKKPRVSKAPKELSPHSLVKGKHIVCFWKQNDLGLFGRRPDRWIALWEQVLISIQS